MPAESELVSVLGLCLECLQADADYLRLLQPNSGQAQRNFIETQSPALSGKAESHQRVFPNCFDLWKRAIASYPIRRLKWTGEPINHKIRFIITILYWIQLINFIAFPCYCNCNAAYEHKSIERKAYNGHALSPRESMSLRNFAINLLKAGRQD